MRYRQNTKGDILYGPPVILALRRSHICEKKHSIHLKTFVLLLVSQFLMMGFDYQSVLQFPFWSAS